MYKICGKQKERQTLWDLKWIKYEKGKGIDGHHSDKVSENPDKMTDPRNIEFMKQEDHIKYHQQYGY